MKGRTNTVDSILERLDVADCWMWTGPLTYQGYARVSFEGRSVNVHRIVFEALVGPIPAGRQLDHLCRNRACANPDHLEPVTPKINTLRGAGVAALAARATECPQGHAYTADNLRVRKDGRRDCRACHRVRNQARKRALRAEGRGWAA